MSTFSFFTPVSCLVILLEAQVYDPLLHGFSEVNLLYGWGLLEPWDIDLISLSLILRVFCLTPWRLYAVAWLVIFSLFFDMLG